MWLAGDARATREGVGAKTVQLGDIVGPVCAKHARMYGRSYQVLREVSVMNCEFDPYTERVKFAGEAQQ